MARCPDGETSAIMAVVRTIAALAALLVCTISTRPAPAGPPLVTDDPETPGRGGWEINISHNIDKTRDELFMETPLVDINYGLLENDQWKIEFPVVFLDPDDGRGRWGAGDLLVGWKYRFREEDEHSLMMSVYPQVSIPTATRHSLHNDEPLVLGADRTELLLPLEVARHFCDEKLLVYGEVGYNVVLDGSGENSWIYGVAAEWQRSEKLDLLFEVGGIALETGHDPDFAFFNGGLKYRLTDRWTLIGSAGRSLRNDHSGAPVLTSFLGFQYTTGNGSPRY